MDINDDLSDSKCYEIKSIMLRSFS